MNFERELDEITRCLESDCGHCRFRDIPDLADCRERMVLYARGICKQLIDKKTIVKIHKVEQIKSYWDSDGSCNHCKIQVNRPTPYCPYCGAVMKGEK